MLRKALVSACAFTVLATCMSGTAYAQFPSDYRTYFTFSGPITLPGVTLPAGKYLFRLPDATGSRRVVQVLSEDGKQSYAMLLAIPAQRFDAPAQPEIRFMETAASTPAAIKTWWYPGHTIGWEFIYPKEQALRLAKAASQPVLTTTQAQNATTEEMKTTDLSRVSTGGEQAAVTVDPKPTASAPIGTTQQGEIAATTLSIPSSPIPAASAAVASSGTQGTSGSATVSNTKRTRLPQTASAAPTTWLLGVLALLTGMGLFTWPRLRA